MAQRSDIFEIRIFEPAPDEFPNQFKSVLTVVMMVTITISLAASVYILSYHGPSSSKDVPSYTLSCNLTVEGDYVIVVQAINGKSAGVEQVELSLIDEQNQNVVYSSVYVVYGVEFGFTEINNVSFWDADLDGRISEFDRFFIRSVANGGVADDGYLFTLRSTWIGERMGTVILQSEKTVPSLSGSVPFIPWDVQIHDDAFSVNESASLFGRPHYLPGTQTFFKFVLDYKEPGTCNVSATALMNGMEFSSIAITTSFGKPAELEFCFNISADEDYLDFDGEIMKEWLLSVKVMDTETNESLATARLPVIIVRTYFQAVSFSTSPFLLLLSICAVMISVTAKLRIRNGK